MGDVVVGTVSLANWEPRYLNLLRKPVNATSFASIDTSLDSTTQPLLLDPVADDDSGANAIWIRCTVYVPPLFVPILLSGKLRPVKA